MEQRLTKALAASLDEGRRSDLHRNFVAFGEGGRNEVGICVARTYLLTLGVRRRSRRGRGKILLRPFLPPEMRPLALCLRGGFTKY